MRGAYFASFFGSTTSPALLWLHDFILNSKSTTYPWVIRDLSGPPPSFLTSKIDDSCLSGFHCCYNVEVHAICDEHFHREFSRGWFLRHVVLCPTKCHLGCYKHLALRVQRMQDCHLHTGKHVNTKWNRECKVWVEIECPHSSLT